MLILKMRDVSMNTNLIVNNTIVPLDELTQNYMGNVLKGIAASLGVNGSEINLLINKETLYISADCEDVIIDEYCMHYLIKCTIKGMISSFEDIPCFETISMSITH